MTLTLDDIQAKRFRMARKNGYEVSEVDEFVDEVEETVAQLVAQADNLKKQVEALQHSGPSAADSFGGVGSAPQQGSLANGIVVSTTKEASAAVVRLVELSTEQAERLVAEASEEAERIREDADRTAQQVTADAKAYAETTEAEARATAERLESEATVRAEQFDHELQERRGRMLSELEEERRQLLEAVADLQRFEAEYRANLVAELRDQIERLETARAEPAPRSGGAEDRNAEVDDWDGSGTDSVGMEAPPRGESGPS